MTTKHTLPAIAIALVAAAGCASKPAAPFDTMPQGTLMAFRLQNFEAPATTTATTPGVAGLPGMPPEIMQWAQQGAAGLQQFLPPGLLPPGLLGGAATTTPAATTTVARFPMTTPNFRILGQTTVMDQDLKEDLAKLFGKEGNYDNVGSACMYAELGFTWQNMGQEQDLLVSFSCNQVQGRGMAWPFPATGMSPGMVKELTALAQKVFPPGT